MLEVCGSLSPKSYKLCTANKLNACLPGFFENIHQGALLVTHACQDRQHLPMYHFQHTRMRQGCSRRKNLGMSIRSQACHKSMVLPALQTAPGEVPSQLESGLSAESWNVVDKGSSSPAQL